MTCIPCPQCGGLFSPSETDLAVCNPCRLMASCRPASYDREPPRKTVYKYPIQPNDTISLTVPLGAQALHFGEQGGRICLWALVDPGEELMEIQQFRMAGTGHTMEDCGAHISTVMLQGGALVFHFFHAH